MLTTGRRRAHHGIYKLPVPGSQLYVVIAPDLIASVEKQPKVISFWHIEAKATARLSGISQKTAAKFLDSIDDGADGFMLKGLNATHRVMVPSEPVDEMVLAASQTSARVLMLSEPQSMKGQIDCGVGYDTRSQ